MSSEHFNNQAWAQLWHSLLADEDEPESESRDGPEEKANGEIKGPPIKPTQGQNGR